jgi:hypothetical protein
MSAFAPGAQLTAATAAASNPKRLPRNRDAIERKLLIRNSSAEWTAIVQKFRHEYAESAATRSGGKKSMPVAVKTLRVPGREP